MITGCTLLIKSQAPVYPSTAYPLYAWMLSQCPPDEADYLHNQKSDFISQYLQSDPHTGQVKWHIHLLDDETAELLLPVLQKEQHIELHQGLLQCSPAEVHRTDFKELVAKGREDMGRKSTLFFDTPASFKQAGRYVIFPQERLIVQSLLFHWNRTCLQYPLEDEDALRMMSENLFITDYRMRSVRHPIKATHIPSFQGSLTMESGLPLPLQEIWNTLLLFAPNCGIGIKTSLGMGGVRIG